MCSQKLGLRNAQVIHFEKFGSKILASVKKLGVGVARVPEVGGGCPWERDATFFPAFSSIFSFPFYLSGPP